MTNTYINADKIRDLDLYIPNTRTTYIMIQALKKGIRKAQIKGIYNADKALKAVTRLVTTASKLYTNDIDNNAHKFNVLFPMPDRKEYAKVLLADILATINE